MTLGFQVLFLEMLTRTSVAAKPREKSFCLSRTLYRFWWMIQDKVIWPFIDHIRNSLYSSLNIVTPLNKTRHLLAWPYFLALPCKVIKSENKKWNIAKTLLARFNQTNIPYFVSLTNFNERFRRIFTVRFQVWCISGFKMNDTSLNRNLKIRFV